MALPTLPPSIPGFVPCADLVWLVDAHAPKLKKFDASQLKSDGVVASWQKPSEGGPVDKPWSTGKDKRLSERTVHGAVELAIKCLDAGLGIGDGYHYATEGGDGSHHYFDGEHEVEHALRQREAFFAGLRLAGFDPLASKRLIFLFDAEHFKVPMSAAERLSILFYMLERLKSELGYAPALYINAAKGVKPFLRDKHGKYGDPLAISILRNMLGRFPLFQPDYDSNTMSSLPRSLATGPTRLPDGWDNVTVWQARSTYLNGLDLSVGDNRRIWT